MARSGHTVFSKSGVGDEVDTTLGGGEGELEMGRQLGKSSSSPNVLSSRLRNARPWPFCWGERSRTVLETGKEEG